MGLKPRSAEAAMTSDALFATAFKDENDAYGVALLNEKGVIITQLSLPARGHSFATHGVDGWSVVFARRPGNFALAFNAAGKTEPILFHAPNGRHFFGHGLFIENGRRLLATENAYETGDGLIGIYDATNNFARIGEFATGGIDPHDMLLMPDGKTLCVANGGILTHPDTGRQKLNLATMQSSIAFIDHTSGSLIAVQHLPDNLQRLSLRHMALDAAGHVWIGGQYEGAKTDAPPLIARVGLDQPLEMVDIGFETNAALANYVGSVAASHSGKRVAFTSPEGGAAIIIDAGSGRIIEHQTMNRVCAIGAAKSQFIFASENGKWGDTKNSLAWDNHAAVLA